MRVLHLGKFYPPAKGGMETILALICVRRPARPEPGPCREYDTPTVEERHGSIEVVRVGGADQGRRRGRLSRVPVQLAREDADLIVLHEPNPMALVAYFLARPEARADRLVSQRRHPSELAVSVVLSPVPAVRARRAPRASSCRPRRSPRPLQQLREWQAKCVVIPFGVERRRRRSPTAVARADEIRREIGSADRAVRRPARPIQGRRRAARSAARVDCGGAGRRRRSAQARARKRRPDRSASPSRVRFLRRSDQTKSSSRCIARAICSCCPR